MINKKSFFKAFLNNPKQTGSIIQSSPFLARKIVSPINFKKAKLVVELGAGTGSVTKEILKQMPEDGILLCFEIDKDLCKKIKKNIKDPRLKTISDGAEKMKRYLSKFGKEQVDYFISELPLVSLGAEISEVILKLISDHLKPHGNYIQIQYSLLGKKKIEKIFPNIKVLFTPLNIPPSFVYVCSQKCLKKQ